MINWPICSMGSQVRFLSGGTPKKDEARFWDGEIPWVSSAEMVQRRIDETVLRVTEDGAKEGSRLIPKNTVLVVVRGMSLAKEFRVAITKKELTFNQDLKALLPSNNLNPVFLFYYLLSQSKAICDSASEAAHGTKKLDMPVLEQWPLPLPPQSTQKKIAAILSTYDDLIENNRRRIALLEKMAEEIYREWFVRMRFPGHEKVKIVKGVPEGWERKGLSGLGTYLNGYAFEPSDWGLEGIPIIKIKEMTKGISFDTPRNHGDAIPAKYHFDDGAIIFSWSASLTVMIWDQGRGLLNQHLFKVDPFSDIPKSFLYFSIKFSIPIFESLTTGATMQHIKRKELDFVQVNLPPQNLRREFDIIVSPILEQKVVLTSANRKLARTRDMLLPRLISGKLSVENLDIRFPPSMEKMSHEV